MKYSKYCGQQLHAVFRLVLKKRAKNVLLPIKRNVFYVHYFDIGRIIFWYKKARVSVRIFNVNNRFIHHRVVIAFMKAPLGNE